MYYLTKFNDVTYTGFSVILKITSAKLCKAIHDIYYPIFIYPFEFGKCGKRKKLQNLNISRMKRAFLME